MLPGVELARRRRVHYHGDSALEHQHHHHYAAAHAHRAGAAVAGPALAARIRLEEKLRGAALPSSATSPSRWSRLMGERETRRATSYRRSRHDLHQQQHEQQAEGGILATTTGAAASAAAGHRRAELTRTLSMVDVCAVCLEEVRERRERVTRLPCSHKYHSECVLPWLAIHPDCPCCRALVPSADALSPS
ncbi:hypothetical protein HU200_048646 [Digitaria exilis]|uniref:RING-type domain-containing protein n=1 Tax=Digitaria exilis TaxID=1010633 RepID=A0A835AUQ2_9POAL|nr:hypothetical protein HU200_048646 [Digitaria exilis]